MDLRVYRTLCGEFVPTPKELLIRAGEGYCSPSVCVCVCPSVCPPVTAATLSVKCGHIIK